MTLRRIRKLGAGDSLTAAEQNRVTSAARASQFVEGSGQLAGEAGETGVSITDHRHVPIWARITGGTNPYSWVQIDENSAPTFADFIGGFAMSGSTTAGQAYEITGRGNIPIGAKVQLHLAPTLDYFIFRENGPYVSNVCPVFTSGFITALVVEYTNADGSVSCVTNPVDCCAIIQSCTVCAGQRAPASLTLSMIANGCALPLCPPPGTSGQVYEPPLVYSANIGAGRGAGWCTGNTAVCIQPPGQTACIFVGVCMYCVAGAYVVDVSRNQQNANCTSGVPVSHTALPVTVSSCDPFCATFTVPGDAVCASPTTYRISADPNATCGSAPPGAPAYNALGTASAITAEGNFLTATATIPSVTVPANSMLTVAVLAAGIHSTNPTTPTFAGTAMTLVGSSAVESTTGENTRTYVYSLHVASATSGNIVASMSIGGGPSDRAAVLVNAAYYSNLANFAPDEIVNSSGAASTPNAGTSGSTVISAEGIYAAIGMFDATPPALGAWQNGFTAGQENTLVVTGTGAGTLRLRDGYKILSTLTTFDPATNDTRQIWGAVGASFS